MNCLLSNILCLLLFAGFAKVIAGLFLLQSCVPDMHSETSRLFHLMIVILSDNLIDAAQQGSLGFIGKYILICVV